MCFAQTDKIGPYPNQVFISGGTKNWGKWVNDCLVIKSNLSTYMRFTIRCQIKIISKKGEKADGKYGRVTDFQILYFFFWKVGHCSHSPTKFSSPIWNDTAAVVKQLRKKQQKRRFSEIVKPSAYTLIVS